MRALIFFPVIAQRVSHAGSTYECIGSLRADSIEGCTGSFGACNFCDLRLSLVGKNFGL